jgi:translation initiation factor 2 subunit 2
MFSNVIEICGRMHRAPEHVVQFLYSELGTSGSMDGMQRLVMKGKFSSKQVETVLRHYISEF